MSRYSKKHYEDIERVIKNSGVIKYSELAYLRLITDFALLFEQDNPNFDRERFLEATR